MDNSAIEAGIHTLIRADNLIAVKYLLTHYTGNNLFKFIETSVMRGLIHIFEFLLQYYDGSGLQTLIKLSIKHGHTDIFNVLYDFYNNNITGKLCLKKKNVPNDMIECIIDYVENLKKYMWIISRQHLFLIFRQ